MSRGRGAGRRSQQGGRDDRRDNRQNDRGGRDDNRGGRPKRYRLGGLWDNSKDDKSIFNGGMRVSDIDQVIREFDLRDDDEIRVVVFSNGYKERDNQPDFVIYYDEPREQNRDRR